MLTPLYPDLLTTREERLPNGYAFRMLSIPAGMVEIGNNEGEEEQMFSWESPRHPVKIPAFELAEFPVTQGLWAAVREVLGREEWEERELPAEPSYFKGLRRPVERVSWWETTAFCELLSQLTGRTYRIPTEAEWEYAARCGRRGTTYAGGNGLKEVGWYYENNNEETMPVGLLAPNDWGLYDMSGNVDEWCANHWPSNHDGAPEDGSAWLTDDESADRVIRGGSWSIVAKFCRVAFRFRNDPGDRFISLGFRLAASLVQDPSRPPLQKGRRK